MNVARVFFIYFCCLYRLEKLNTSTHLNQSLVTTTTNDCISKILIIQSLLLKRNCRTIRNHTIDDDTQSIDVDTVQHKKLKSQAVNHGNEDVDQTQTEKDQIHLIANLLDLLEVGGNDQVLGMVDVIKLAQLTVSYFFWSLYEKSWYPVRLRTKFQQFHQISP